MSKPIKVPAMRKLQPYKDWKKELEVWKANNEILEVDKKLQAGFLFQSLEGLTREAVLSELTTTELTAEDGVEKIIKTLDTFYMENEVKGSYNSIDELMSYKREKDNTLEEFIIKFQIMVNKVKASGTTLSQGVLGYALLKSACLPEEKLDMIKATCHDLSFQNVKCQIEKIGLFKVQSKAQLEFSSSKVKIEQAFYSKESYDSWSSDDDTNGESVLYAKSPQQNSNPSGKHQLNSSDRFGFIRACSYCKCVYHWLANCPYAPESVKVNLKTKDARGKASKPL